MNYDYDLVVIGGGSGGISCARESSKLGAKVALFDFVKPSPQGTRWGLGGTCVNVGCIPKKLMHYSGLLGASLHDAKALGWKFSNPEHNWEAMVSTIQDHIMSLNWGYRTDMMKNKVKYIKALARFVGPNTVAYTKKGEEVRVTAKKFVIAVGGRPTYPDIPNVQKLAISSDDIFSMVKPPGKTLLVGASYISLETAGFLTELGYDVTVAVRSILLRGFDQECAKRIGTFMGEHGTKFLHKATPTNMQKAGDRIEVTFLDESKTETTDVFDTVMIATGRRADTDGLDLPKAGIEVCANGKLAVDAAEKTNVDHIFAVGDVLEGRQELTPVAIHTGVQLARRMFGQSKALMNYELVPTTVFTPIEYGCIGLSEEDAISKYGSDDIETYLTAFNPLELMATHRANKSGVDLENPAFAKLVCVKSDRERVIGFHYVGMHAGEVTQGFAVAMKLGATKGDFDDTVGIHPTSAESFTTLHVTRSSGVDFQQSGC